MKALRIASQMLTCSNRFHRKLWRYLPYQFSAYDFSTERLEQKEISIREKLHISRPSVKKWKRQPFIKNLFLGKFDTVLLALPEVLDKEHLAQLESIVKVLNDLYMEKVNSVKVNDEKTVSHEILQELKEMGLFGRMVPLNYGGLGLTYTEYTRLSEVLGLDWSVYTILAAHECSGIQALLTFGNEAQKEKYLPNLASGKCIAALCFHESQSGCDPNAIETTAECSLNGSNYIINGTKTWVTNAEIADLFIVITKTQKKESLQEEELSVFLVDRDDSRMKITNTEKIGLLASRASTVCFSEVEVPVTNLLEKPGSGANILLKLHEAARFSMGSFTFGALKALLDRVTECLIDTERLEKCLADMQLVRKRLSNIATMIYAMESVSYFTAALYDTTENPDCALESAIVKVFNSETTLLCLQELKKALGSSSILRNHQLEEFYRDAQALSFFENTNDMTLLYIGLNGCQFAGSKIFDKIVKMRNPLFHPWDKVKSQWKHSRIREGKFNFNQDIAGHLHPSLVECGNELEKLVQLFELTVENVLSNHGIKIVDSQFDPVRLAEIVINIYVMTAVLSRSSRSYCIGLRHADNEIRIATALCRHLALESRRLIKEISDGVYVNNDDCHFKIGEQIVGRKCYFPEHPLKHNF